METSYLPQQFSATLPMNASTGADIVLPTPTQTPRKCDISEIIQTVKETVGTEKNTLRFTNVRIEDFKALSSYRRPYKSIRCGYNSTTGAS